jgi:rare lipoprotein A
MGRAKGRAEGLSKQRACAQIARLGVLAVACLGLAACSSANLASKNATFSKRVVDEGQPVPKGGGNYKVGQPYQLNGRTYYPAENPGYRAEGIASWYGPDFHGRETANGEVYDMHGISAAHTTLPIPSYARVTNLENGRSIIVRVNDRGPYAGDRLIDLSIGTAKALDFYSKGLARVRVEYVGRAPLEGSDDKLLMATLRHGSPAPAPSLVMVASAKPLLPADGGAGETAAPLPVARPFALGGAPARVGAQISTTQAALTDRKTQSGPQSVASGPARPVAPAAAFAPARAEGAALTSGRGLY